MAFTMRDAVRLLSLVAVFAGARVSIQSRLLSKTVHIRTMSCDMHGLDAPGLTAT
jgi:hypothetical protein